MKFNEMGLIAPILENLSGIGHINPTAIQASAIPLLLQGNDLLGIAQTGTGKTAAFSLPIIQHLITNRKLTMSGAPRVLIIAPTRELCSQIKENLDTYGNNLNLKTAAIFGGVGQAEQVKNLKAGTDVVVATPGRLLDLIDQGQMRLGSLEIFVLDEADRMLDLGFSEELEKIIKNLPATKQTMLFSATMPKEIEGLARRLLKNPKLAQVAPTATTVEKVEQKIIFCKRDDKFQLLRKIIKEEEVELVIVFTKTKNSADKVKEYLLHHRIPAAVFHGDKDQKDRERALRNFKAGSMKVLIATDIAARGIDVEDVSHVINFELPMEAESYVHRIGRTARAGKEGKAISFVDEGEKSILERIEKLIQLRLPTEKFKGNPEAKGIWLEAGAVRKVTAPTPGKSQEKSAYIDHSKRQRVVEEGAPKPKPHPGFRSRKKR